MGVVVIQVGENLYQEFNIPPKTAHDTMLNHFYSVYQELERVRTERDELRKFIEGIEIPDVIFHSDVKGSYDDIHELLRQFDLEDDND